MTSLALALSLLAGRIRRAHKGWVSAIWALRFSSFPPLLTREWVVNTTKNFLYCFVICIRKFFCAVAHSCWSHKHCQQKKWSASQKLPTMLANPNKAWRVGHFDLTNESNSWAPHLHTASHCLCPPSNVHRAKVRQFQSWHIPKKIKRRENHARAQEF